MKLTDDRIFLTYEQGLKGIAMSVIKRAMLDAENPFYMCDPRNKKEIEKFFLDGMADFYLAFMPVKTTGEEIYNTILRGGEIVWLS